MGVGAVATSTVVTALVAAVAVVVLGLVFTMRRVAVLRRDYRAAVDRDEREDVFAVLRRHADEQQRLRRDLLTVHGNTERLATTIDGALSNVAIVRYDAFSDVGGGLSFSAAVLDAHGNGLVLTSINGRADGRSYAKSVVAGASDQRLSGEEEEAIAAALGRDGGRARPRRRDRRLVS